MATIFEIRVVPQSGKTGFALDKSGRLKCYLKSPAEKGLANKELIKNLAKALNVTQDEVTIVSGQTSRNKRIKISRDLTVGQLIVLLGIEKQQSLF